MQTLPAHLQKYIISQDSHQYSGVEQATWRYILKHLSEFLTTQAHPDYSKGLTKTGITLNQIPKIQDISKHLHDLGWIALPVSGFIPPAAFMELQSLGVLPIATEMRSFEHLLYTPAPDIVHEAAGHAPMLANLEYSEYLKSYAQVSRRAILSKDDHAIYRAIRILSDLKESPGVTQDLVAKANHALVEAQSQAGEPSEAALLARMNWWTAEYGLIGDLKSPRIYGAGLLSSLGESRTCLSDKVTKIPLTLDCLKFSYDITEPQPQLFVTPDFNHLKSVLRQFSETMGYVIGGITALQKAKESGAVTACRLDSGLEIGGIVETFERDNEGSIAFIKWSGPCQLAHLEREIPGHGITYHSSGFSTPIGRLENSETPPHLWSDEQWLKFGYRIGSSVVFEFVSGVTVTGILKNRFVVKGSTLLVTLDSAHMTFRGETLFDPSWGTFDMALGTKVTSLWGGAPDRSHFLEHDDFESIHVPKKSLTEGEQKKDAFFKILHQFQIGEKSLTSLDELESLRINFTQSFGHEDLFLWEIDQLKRTLNI